MSSCGRDPQIENLCSTGCPIITQLALFLSYSSAHHTSHYGKSLSQRSPLRYRLACVPQKRGSIGKSLLLSSQVFCASPAIWYEHAILAFVRLGDKLAVNLRSLLESL